MWILSFFQTSYYKPSSFSSIPLNITELSYLNLLHWNMQALLQRTCFGNNISHCKWFSLFVLLCATSIQYMYLCTYYIDVRTRSLSTINFVTTMQPHACGLQLVSGTQSEIKPLDSYRQSGLTCCIYTARHSDLI